CSTDPNVILESWLKLFYDTVKGLIPHRKIKVSPRDQPWITPFVRHCINVRHRTYKRARSRNDLASWETFHTAGRNYCKAIQDAKRDYYKHLYESLNDPNTCGKKWWRLTKSVYGNKKGTGKSLPDIVYNGNVISDVKDKCEILNSFFVQQSSLNDANVPLPTLSQIDATCDVPFIQSDTVKKILESLNPSKATGPDGISNYLLRNISSSMASPLASLFNYSLQAGVFPKSWKIANVTPLYKKGDKSNPTAYRPVALLSCLSKVFEKCVANVVQIHLDVNRLITKRQSGFIPGDSTVNQLITINDIILSAFEKGDEVHAIFLDISRAFDKVWRRGLLHKLKFLFGIHGNFLAWFDSYISDRQQRVVINGCSSSLMKTDAGVPQGSVLGPILFIMFINDLSTAVISDLFLFADDSTLINVFSEAPASIMKLNTDLLAIEDWAKTW
ncbi:MAG: reverse transcriptase family protein, partial [Candidatus Omnitrophica bacterium]|nr:reverse transcriptase family protein [Candidatus Omnitrophota bacterium]